MSSTGSCDPSDAFDHKRDSLLSAITTTKEFVEELCEYSKSKVIFHLPSTPTTSSFKVLKFHHSYQHQPFRSQSSVDGDPLRIQLHSICQHLGRISVRLALNTSKILVTGDLNAGKSTFINALLGGSPILPTDQQPCTMAFCEVVQKQAPAQDGIKLDQSSSKDGKSSSRVVVHAFSNGHDEETGANPESIMTLEEMQHNAANPEAPFTWYRIWYPPDNIQSEFHDSHLTYSLIDSPGLNTDFLKTMSLFTRQEDIDVVVFLINASNHLTLSARDFLHEAAKEKSLVFTVVNRMDEIKDKEKCKRIILSQVKEVLPLTFDAQSELIHFVSAIQHVERRAKNESVARNKSLDEQECLNGHLEDDKLSNDTEWRHLIESLKRFVFVKRTQSKLCPAQTFLLNLLEDLSILLEVNKSLYNEKYQKISLELTTSESEWEKLQSSQDRLLDTLDAEIDKSCTEIYAKSRTRLLQFIESIETLVHQSEWRGFLRLGGYVHEVQERITKAAHHEMLEGRREALEIITTAIYSLFKQAGAMLPQIYDNPSEPVHPDIPGTLSCADPIVYKDDLRLSVMEAMAFSLSFPASLVDWALGGLRQIPLVGWVCSFASKVPGKSFRWMRIACFAGIGLLGFQLVGRPLWSIASIFPFGQPLLCLGAVGLLCASVATPRSIRSSLVQQAHFHYTSIGASAPFSTTPPMEAHKLEPIESNLAMVEQFPRLLESGARKLLRVPCNDLVTRWHTWMTRTRRERQEREGMRRRWATTVEYFDQTRTSLLAFRRSVEAIHL